MKRIKVRDSSLDIGGQRPAKRPGRRPGRRSGSCGGGLAPALEDRLKRLERM